MLGIVVPIVTGLLACGGVAFSTLALWAARAYLRDQRRVAVAPVVDSALPPVSILKPLKGLDPGLLQALETHCQQEYPAPWEMLFGLSDLEDPAARVLTELAARHPEASLRIVHCPLVLGANGKVSNLAQMLPHARYEHILIADGDISVGASYLRAVMAPFARDARTGLVTVPYRGVAHGATLGARLEALAISTDFFPGVLTARWLERGVHFGMGSTLATTRAALTAIGSLEPLAGYLGDDYELGARIHRAGLRVEMPLQVVETAVAPYSWQGFWDHQMRWARSVRDSRRWGYLGVAVTHPVPWAALTVVATAGAVESWLLLALALLARFSVALMIGGAILRDRAVLPNLPLLPLRDCVALLLWAGSYADNTVLWRGERLRLSNGRLLRLTPAAPQVPPPA